MPSYIWVISSLARADLAMYLESMTEQRKLFSLVLVDSRPYPTSDGLETA